MLVEARITEVATGIVASVIWKSEWKNIEYARNWWTEGNGGCDCNRELEFLRATTGEPQHDPPCGNGRYTVEVLEAKV